MEFLNGEGGALTIFFQVIKYLPYRYVCVLAHNLNVVEDGAVCFHGLPDAVFQRFKWYAQLKAVLYKRLTS